MACWALWQRLPPRYQLTTKEVPGEEFDLSLSSPRASQFPRTPGSPRTKTPSHSDGSPRRSRATNSARMETPGSAGRGQATMYFTVTSPRDVQTDTRSSPRPAFPLRRSSFVNSFKQQQRINSARQMFQDPSTATPKSYTPTMRASTAPTTSTTQFPVTHLASHQNNTECSKHSPPHSSRKHETPQEADRSRIDRAQTPKRIRTPSKSAGAKSNPQAQLAVNTILPFDTTMAKPFLKNPMYPDPNGKRYVFRGMNNATMFIDNDKVVVIKNKKSHQTQFDDTTSYIANLRKIYLNEPRDLAKITKTSERDPDKSLLIRERLEYEKRTDHILNYYRREVEARDFIDSHGRRRSGEETRNSHSTPTIPKSARAASSRERRLMSASSPRSPTRSRPQSARPTTSPRRTPTSHHAWQNHDQQVHYANKRDALADWNVFLKINSQSTLHERQFYLQTPAVAPSHHEPVVKPTTPDCSCRLCKLEMEMALTQNKEGSIVILPDQKRPPQTHAHAGQNDAHKDYPGRRDVNTQTDEQQEESHNAESQSHPGSQQLKSDSQGCVIDMSQPRHHTGASSQLSGSKRNDALCEDSTNNPQDNPQNPPTSTRQVTTPLVIPSEDIGRSQESLVPNSESDIQQSSDQDKSFASLCEEGESLDVTSEKEETRKSDAPADSFAEGKIIYAIKESKSASEERGQDHENVDGTLSSTPHRVHDNNNNETYRTTLALQHA